MKKLSIIVPVYNGETTIEDTVRSIVSQVELFKENVEFIVRDNASTDKTSSIVKKIMEEYPGCISYNRREETALADINYKESILLSSGEFFVTIGDDDLIMPGYLEHILQKLEANPDLGLIYVNRITVTRDYQRGFVRGKNYNANLETLYQNPRDFICDHILGPDFMSVNIVRKACYEEGLKYFDLTYHGYVWLSIILFGIQGYKCLYIQSPMILQRVPQVRVWDDRKTLFSLYGMTKMYTELDKIYPGVRAKWEVFRRPNAYTKLSCIPLNRKLYRTIRGEIRPFLRGDERFIYDMLLYVPVLKYPFRFVVLAYKIYNYLKHRNIAKIKIEYYY